MPPPDRTGRLSAGHGAMVTEAVALSTTARGEHQPPPPSSDADPATVALAWKAQRRLHHVWRRMEQHNKRRTIIAVACARKLAGFCWPVATA